MVSVWSRRLHNPQALFEKHLPAYTLSCSNMYFEGRVSMLTWSSINIFGYCDPSTVNMMKNNNANKDIFRNEQKKSLVEIIYLSEAMWLMCKYYVATLF